MRILLFCIPVWLCCLLGSTSVYAQVQKLYLHPKAPAREKQSLFVDSIRFIPLEIKEGIQLSSYNNIEVTDKYFLIVDYPAKAILLYSRSGAFVKKISFKKLGGNLYPSYREHSNQVVFFGNNKNYSLTPKDELKIMLDWNNPRNKKYYRKYTIDLDDTSFAVKKNMPDENDILQASHFFDDYYWRGEITTSNLYDDSLDHEVRIYRNNQQVKAYFPYNRINEARFLYTEESADFIKTDTPYIHLVSRPFCDTVYKMIHDSLFPAYHLVLPLENSLPASFFNRPFKNKTERENFIRNNGMLFKQVSNIYETPRFIFFSVRYLRNHESYIYQKGSQVTYRVRNVKADTSQYNLQLLGDQGLVRKGDRIYKPEKAGDLQLFFEQNSNVPVPGDLEEFFKNKPPGTTPVIVEFKYKNQP